MVYLGLPIKNFRSMDCMISSIIQLGSVGLFGFETGVAQPLSREAQVLDCRETMRNIQIWMNQNSFTVTSLE